MALTPLPVEPIESQKMVRPLPYPVFGEAAVAAVTSVSVEAQRLQKMEEMLQEAQGRAESMEREAYDKAYAAGEKAGLALGEKRAEQILEAMQICLNQAELHSQQFQKHTVDAVVDIAQSMTEFLIGDLLSEQRDVLFKAAQRAAEQLPDIQALHIAIHPHDIESFKRLLPEQQPDWKVFADSNVAEGSCRLISKHQDALVDPIQAIDDVVQRIRADLQRDGLQQGDIES